MDGQEKERQEESTRGRVCLAQSFSVQVPAKLLGILRQSSLGEQWVGQCHGVNTWQAFGGTCAPQEGFTSVCCCYYYFSEMEEANTCG